MNTYIIFADRVGNRISFTVQAKGMVEALNLTLNHPSIDASAEITRISKQMV